MHLIVNNKIPKMGQIVWISQSVLAVLDKSFWRSRNLFSKRFLAAGASMLLDPYCTAWVFSDVWTSSHAIIGSPSMGPAGGPKTGDF